MGRARTRLAARVTAAIAAALLTVNLTLVETSANSVTAKRMDLSITTTNAENLKPSNCSAITLTTVLRGSGTVTGGASAELILAGTGIDNISGGSGSDCILGGAGNDVINGGAGTDVCIGGPGTDVFSLCETQVQ